MINSSARQDKERKIVLAQILRSLSCLRERPVNEQGIVRQYRAPKVRPCEWALLNCFIEKEPGHFNYFGI